MVTRDQAVSLAVEAIGSRKTSALDYTNPFGAQCIALDAWYLEQIGYKTPIMPGYNAIDVWTKNPLNLEKVVAPQPGDIFFANQKGSDGINYGHTGIVVTFASAGFYSIDQNWINANIDTNGGSPAAKIFHPFSYAVGYLRPNYSQGGEDMITDADNEYGRWAKLGYQIRGRQMSRDEFRAGAVGKTWLQAMEILSDNSEADTATKAQELGQLAGKDSWQGQIYGLQGQLKAEQQKTIDLTANLADATSRLDGAAASTTDLDAKLKAIQATADATAHERDDLRTQVATVQTALNAANDTITQLKAEAEKPPAPSTPQTNNPPIDTPTPQTQTTTTWVDALLRAMRIKR